MTITLHQNNVKNELYSDSLTSPANHSSPQLCQTLSYKNPSFIANLSPFSAFLNFSSNFRKLKA